MAAEAGAAWTQDRVDAVVDAARAQRWDEVHIAPDAGFPVNAADAEGRTLAHWAAAFGHLPTLTRVLALGADPDARNRWGRTPVHLAAEYGHLEAVQALVGAGGGVNAADKWGRAPLMNAAYFGRLPVVRYLLTLPQTDLLATTLNGQTSAHLADVSGHFDVRIAIRREVGALARVTPQNPLQ